MLLLILSTAFVEAACNALEDSLKLFGDCFFWFAGLRTGRCVDTAKLTTRRHEKSNMIAIGLQK